MSKYNRNNINRIALNLKYKYQIQFVIQVNLTSCLTINLLKSTRNSIKNEI